jgi:hypothetical protein
MNAKYSENISTFTVIKSTESETMTPLKISKAGRQTIITIAITSNSFNKMKKISELSET